MNEEINADSLIKILGLQKKIKYYADECDLPAIKDLIRIMGDEILSVPELKRTTELIWDDTLNHLAQSFLHCSCSCKKGSLYEEDRVDSQIPRGYSAEQALNYHFGDTNE